MTKENINHLHEEVEVEEVFRDEEEYDVEYGNKRAQERKIKYSNRIMGELEAYLERGAKEWEVEDETILLDLLGLVNNAIKSHLSNNNEGYTG